MTSITIGVVDDHPLFREGVTRSLSEISGFIVVGEGASSDDAAMIASDNHPDIMLLDVSMPGGGLSAISDVLARSPTTKVLMLTVSEEVDTLLGALQRGAMGYVLKGVGSRGLAEAIQTVLRGSRYISPTMSAKVMENSLNGGTSDKSSLTPREREVMDLVAQGLSNKHIGLRLNLQEKTVKHHMTQILSKLGASNRTEAALQWRERR
ncbi:response regulator transcription factor [Rhizobium leguminosarum]|jgi:two-component system, NarL family, nitrate/nitrite response regulator NarL|uniref:Two-component system nitrate/nitrite response regulator NarL n=2 Tax=Rhizobium TaxID=379 RepID=A0ABR6GBY6_9HYPH|nr:MULTISPECIES: response regulator transcription factor [Rhizobium]MBB3163769.1 two-component system nitrate/nitrite response regulator NarL [Rhizobium laguerreae]MBY3036461.1 response regulator transcription factor [Rhizobium laguerreae]MBY3173065.1 response regulator transcription factor [Rhizobium leguminosarum]MBY3215830.1 response regulator transcription factor [Rhizobium laguerreae]MBY3344252.1 response regulator transcription factor [Rhizobium laguerreae]